MTSRDLAAMANSAVHPDVSEAARLQQEMLVIVTQAAVFGVGTLFLPLMFDPSVWASAGEARSPGRAPYSSARARYSAL